jgi:GNAT superfamily N-acetyltransferase
VIRQCTEADFETILAIINDAAEAYRAVIPSDRWKEPYMGADELRHEIAAGVSFSGAGAGEALVGVMGIQPVGDVILIRHAYVRTAQQGQGVGGELLAHLIDRADRAVLIGTWAAARWAIGFYEGKGFEVVAPDDKDRLLKTYWSIPERQIETSVVLADARWWRGRGAAKRDPVPSDPE